MDNFYYVKHMLQNRKQYTTKFNDHFTKLYQSSVYVRVYRNIQIQYSQWKQLKTVFVYAKNLLK